MLKILPLVLSTRADAKPDASGGFSRKIPAAAAAVAAAAAAAAVAAAAAAAKRVAPAWCVASLAAQAQTHAGGLGHASRTSAPRLWGLEPPRHAQFVAARNITQHGDEDYLCVLRDMVDTSSIFGRWVTWSKICTYI